MKYINPDSKQYFAFNIWSMESAQAVMDAASALGRDVVLQTSMKAFHVLDKEVLRSFVTEYMHKKNVHAYLHLDHCTGMEGIHEAVEQGWDSVMLDASDKPLEENIALVNEACSLAAGKDILVEAEIGRIGGAEEGVPAAEAGIARFEDVERFLRDTKVDMLAAAVGTSHGLYHGTPELHFDLIEKIAGISDIPLVIHGGTGLPDEALMRLLSYKNIKKINISTDVKMAYRQGIEGSIRAGYLEEEGFDPLKVAENIRGSVHRMAENKLRLLERSR